MNIQLPTIKKSKGFALTYFLIILATILFVEGAIVKQCSNRIRFLNELEDFRLVNWTEVLVIDHIKYQCRNYQTTDENINFNDCQIKIHYTSKGANFTIDYGDIKRIRTIVYDEIDEIVLNYY